MNRIDYSSSVMNSPPKLYLPFEQVKNTIQYPNLAKSTSPKLSNMIFLACCQTYSTKFI